MLEDRPWCTTNYHNQTRQQPLHVQQRKQEMFPSSCLDGSITRVGPGLNPQYTRAWYAREAEDCSLNSTQPMHKRAVLSDMAAEQRLRQFHNLSDLFTRRVKTRLCVSVVPYQNLWSESVQGGSDPITDRVMDRSVVQRGGVPSCCAEDAEDRGDSASAVHGVLGQGEGCRHDR